MALKTVAAYIAAQPRAVQPLLTRVRTTIRKALPQATEGISYQMPVYKVNGAMVLYFAAYKKFISIYPATPALLAALGDKLDGKLHHKATLRFPIDAPLPTALIARIAKLRAKEVAATKSPTRKLPVK